METKVKLTFLGGVNEVGGNMVLLEDNNYDVKIIIDFGINIRNYMDHYERNEDPKSLDELIKLGLLPDINNLPIINLYTNCKDTQNPNIDGILISHPHKDHFFGLPFINRNIPVYAGVVTYKIINAFYKSSKNSIINDYSGLKWRLFRTGEIINLKGLEIIPFHVDHSIPAAYGFIIKSSSGVIIYSGDFRMHGPLSWMTYDFLKEAQVISSGNLKALICEGTHIHKGAIESEQRVRRSLNQLFKKIPFDYILVKYDKLDWDRFRTFSSIAKRKGWKYIITEKDAYFYYLLNKNAIYETMRNPNIIKDEHIYILTHGNVKYHWQEKIRRTLYEKQKGHRIFDYKEMKKFNGNFICYFTTLSNELITNLNQNLKGVFISSSIDPYTEEFMDNNKFLKEKFIQYGIPSYRIHASGHAMPHHIINFINYLSPENLIPIHTEHPEFFKSYFKNSEMSIIIPEKFKSIHI